MGLHYIFKGAEMGRPGLIAGLQENPTQLERIVNGFGWSLDRDDVHVMYRSPVDMYLDEWVYELLAAVEEHGIRRILIDSLGTCARPPATRSGSASTSTRCSNGPPTQGSACS